MKAQLRRFVPPGLVRLRWTLLNRMALQRLPPIPCDTRPLGQLDRLPLERILCAGEAQEEWSELQRELATLGITSKAGGVNPGDQRALYSIVRALKPRSVLEIGTHVGASTVAIAAALRRLRTTEQDLSFRLWTVDIRDVNDPIARPWRQLGSDHSPAEMIARLGCGDFVTFATGASLEYLAMHRVPYDLIFLDGDHSAGTVYQEVPAALRRLAPGGFILLHDYYPDMLPLWDNGMVSPGPYLATRRLQAEGADVGVRPFGALPWPTKLNSNVTSLAVLGRVSS